MHIFTVRRCPNRLRGQVLAEETEELVKTSVAAMRADIAETPPWHGAPAPTDEFLLMFLRSEVFSPAKAADRYRKFWKVRLIEGAGKCSRENSSFRLPPRYRAVRHFSARRLDASPVLMQVFSVLFLGVLLEN